MQRKSVVLPEPEGPTSTVVLCASIVSETPFSTWLSPKVFCMSFT